MKTILSSVLMLLGGLSVQAQITIPSSTLPALGDKLRYSWAYDQGTFDMVTAPGFDLTWNFTGLTADENITEEYLSPSEGVYAARFPTANLMTRNAAGEERYFIVSASGLRELGFTKSTLFGEPFTVVYDYTWKGAFPDPGLNERFTPLNFFDTYARHASILEGYKFSEMPPALQNAWLAAGLTTTDSIRLRYSYDNFYSVNANGTLTIPGPNGEFPVLRMNTTQFSEGRVDAHVIPLGWLDITDLTMQYIPASIASIGIDTIGAHTFFNDVTKEEIARITLDSQGRPHHVRFKNNASPACFDPDLVNATLNDNPLAAGEYLASQTLQSAGRVATGTTVQFVAGLSIALQPGFKAEAGSAFTARIDNCPSNSALLSLTENSVVSPVSFQTDPPVSNDIPRLLKAEGRLNVYPNPVRTTAKIDYALSEPGPVWMGIADANGRLLIVLEQTEWQEAGNYSLDWTPTDSGPGTFYVLLKMNEGVVSKKLVLIK